MKLDRMDPEFIRFISDEVERDSKKHLHRQFLRRWTNAVLIVVFLVFMAHLRGWF